MRIRKLPNDDSGCGWFATLPPPAPARRVTSEERADCAVVGAGFTGLATARQLAAHRPDWRIVLLDAQRVGYGSSGRNSGFVVDVGHYEPRWGVERNRRLVRLGRAGRDHLRELVRAHAIECGWTEKGRLHGAVGAAGMRALDMLYAGLDAMGEPYEALDAAKVTAVTGTTYYRAAASTPGAVMVQPSALARGLAASLPPTVDLFEESPVRAIRRDSQLVLEAGDGVVVTDRLFLATNGLTPSLGFLQRRLFPVFTFASLSRVLDGEERVALGGEPEWGLVPEERMGSTVRRTRDQRILIRNTIRYAAGVDAGRAYLDPARKVHRRAFRARFPMLPRVDLEYTWGGIVAASINTAHWFGKLEDKLFATAGYNGVGVASGTVAGKLLADLALGADSELLDEMRLLPVPGWVPPAPFLGMGVRLSLAYMAARAREEV